MKRKSATRLTETFGLLTLLALGLLIAPTPAQASVDTVDYPPVLDSTRSWYGEGEPLRWSWVPGADSYHLQVSDTRGFPTGTIDVGGEGSAPMSALIRDVENIYQTMYTLDIETGGVYYWRVRGVAFGNLYGPWSTVGEFEYSVSSVPRTDNHRFTAGPNPCYSCLYRLQSSDGTLERLRVYDLSGRLLLSEQYVAGTTGAAINLSELSSGIYHVVVTERDGSLETHQVLVR